MKIYVVQGHTGEYDDKSQWLVRGFRDADKAKEFAEECTEIAAEIHRIVGKDYWQHGFVHALDPKFMLDYTGTTYEYLEMDLDTDS